MKIFKTFYTTIALSLPLILSGCGFHLRGTDLTPIPKQRIWIQNDTSGMNNSIISPLKQALKIQKFNITEDQGQAQWILSMNHCSINHNLSQMTGGALGGQYLVTTSCQILINTPDHQVVVPPITLKGQSSFSSNATLQLSLNNQLRQAESTATSTLITRIVTVIRHIPTQPPAIDSP